MSSKNLRKIETYVSVDNIRDQIAALLYASGIVFDHENVVDMEFDKPTVDKEGRKIVPISIWMTKERTVTKNKK